MKIDEYAIEMYNITKIFNKEITANSDVNLKIKKGEIHALLGENGSGKTTLMSILFGLYKPTFGNIWINGKEILIENSQIAKQLGIGMIHQHFKLIDNFTVWENIFLSYQNNKKILINKKQIIKKIKIIFEKYNFKIDLNKKISELPVGDLQKIEIIKVLINDSDILIFDEPTAVLLKTEIIQFLDILKNLKNQGKTIIFITHKLNEIKDLSDNISIMRNGKLIETFLTNSKTIKEIANLMIGRKLVEIKNNDNKVKNKIVLKINNLTVKINKIEKIKKLSLEIKKGEILAIAGISDNGQNELLEAISGINKNFTGSIFIDNLEISKLNTNKIYEYISYITEDRIKNGIALNLNVLDNILLQNLYRKPFVNKLGFLNRESNVHYSQKIINNYNVKSSENGYAQISHLSGGNQQKIVVGREIEKPHKVLLISNPTRGVDLGAIEYIHKQILKEKKSGNAILLASTELDEIISLADRVMVISGGKNKGELSKDQINKENIGILMLGKERVLINNEK